jgi:predicted ester cyclase
LSADALIDAWEAAWSGHDPHAFRPICVAAVHYEDPLCATPLVGVAALGEHAVRLWAAFPDARLESTGARLSDGRFLAAPGRLSGTHRAPLGDLPATGRALAFGVVFYCELEGGRLRRVRAFFDPLDAGRQLGIMPARGGLGERALLVLRGFGLRRARGLWPAPRS